MDLSTTESLESLIERVNDLRAKARVEPFLSPLLDEIRSRLAGALSNIDPSSAPKRPSLFRVSHDGEGTYRLHTDGGSVPLNPRVLDEASGKERGTFPFEFEIWIDAATARRLIEESLARFGRDQALHERYRRELLRLFMLADESAERSDRCA